MNKTGIDWCDYTWNPVTGCLHGCPYCYARRTTHRHGTPYDKEDLHVLEAKRGPYPFEFAPTLHRYRMDEPLQKKKGCNIFVCSMADLFGEWVPVDWISSVLNFCKQAPQHTYMFLTKNPDRYLRLAAAHILPTDQNYWYGTTVTGGNSVARFGHHSFLSVEPLLAPLDWGAALSLVEWVIVGAQTGPGAVEHQPRREWVETIVETCREAGIPVFMKKNLAQVWGEALIQEYPEGMQRQEEQK